MRNILITGGAGFIGSNLAKHFAAKNYKVTIFDNLSRFGAKENIKWLKVLYPNIEIIVADIRDDDKVKKAVQNKDVILHLAGQVAVTTSVVNPRFDFEANALGTLNVLEAARLSGTKPIIVYASTNKVYGGMEQIKIIKKGNHYAYRDFESGIPESMNLDFHSPYGCSKGVGDQYVRDYERIYGIPTVVFRQSCIYGPRQFGVEDQGWLAWFILAITFNKPITIYGDGMQVRDILYIDDLSKAYEMAIEKIDKARGEIYNVGGGKDHTISIWRELEPILEDLFGRKIKPKFGPWRPGDQKVYISDITKIAKELGWKPKIKVKEGIEKLYNWIYKNIKLFKNYV
ncbi:SDR family NAD(P)-dependent oxidoreductase [Candidatus Gottesmanbacteria bacterium]|nr:SDR family NAD(P)-dependent oxidoreductase [Candidatus Gottesmanbacteria bacterium]